MVLLTRKGKLEDLTLVRQRRQRRPRSPEGEMKCEVDIARRSPLGHLRSEIWRGFVFMFMHLHGPTTFQLLFSCRARPIIHRGGRKKTHGEGE